MALTIRDLCVPSAAQLSSYFDPSDRFRLTDQLQFGIGDTIGNYCYFPVLPLKLDKSRGQRLSVRIAQQSPW